LGHSGGGHATSWSPNQNRVPLPGLLLKPERLKKTISSPRVPPRGWPPGSPRPNPRRIGCGKPPRALFGVRHRVVGEPLPEVRHPPGGAFLQEILLDDPLNPVPRPGLVRSAIAAEKSPASIMYAPRPGLRPGSPGPWPQQASCAGGSPSPRGPRGRGSRASRPSRRPAAGRRRAGPSPGSAFAVQFPVPPQLRTETPPPLPYPILQPEGGDGRVQGFELGSDPARRPACPPRRRRVSSAARDASCRRTLCTTRLAPPACRR
jgi:hypothetical protein